MRVLFLTDKQQNKKKKLQCLINITIFVFTTQKRSKKKKSTYPHARDKESYQKLIQKYKLVMSTVSTN